ncbi:MAG TPA: DUF5069 domain-containing protein [Limnochordia bacterium]
MSATEWKPRGRDVVIGGIPWLARMTDKARAKAAGTIGDYIYPCPQDQKLLAELGLTGDEFLKIAVSAKTDEEVVEAVRQAKVKR